MKIYTRQGDDGKTALRFGERVEKSAPRVEAYGAVDEANAALGGAVAALTMLSASGRDDRGVRAMLLRVQRELFELGAELAVPASRAGGEAPRTTDAMVSAIEADIDRLEAGLPPLRTFILPGGGAAGAALHLARAVTRRAERRVVALAAAEPVAPVVVRYLNRLSDFLFVAARAASAAEGAVETLVE